MKLEEVLQHLRNGGKVKIVEFASTNKSYDLEELNSMLTFSGLSRKEFEIIEEPYKKEHIVEFDTKADYSIDGSGYETLLDIFPRTVNKTYKVTIEEIKK